MLYHSRLNEEVYMTIQLSSIKPDTRDVQKYKMMLLYITLFKKIVIFYKMLLNVYM